MRTIALSLALGIGALCLSAPVVARESAEQADRETIEGLDGEFALDSAEAGDDGEMDAADMEAFAELMGGLFQTEPLTPEQDARLPAARDVVAVMLPEGFYADMMGGVMEKTMGPMMRMFSSPELLLQSRLAVDEGAIAALDEDERRELISLLDPAWDRRGDAIMAVVSGELASAFTVLEPPVRDGLARAYAVRFDQRQLADIAAFFATPTGSEFGRESFALFADPQVIGSAMQAMPQMLGNFANLEGAMTEALETLPAERGFGDLSAEQRRRIGEILDMSPAALEDAIRPPRDMMDDE